jgi:hypothetical protein
MESFISSSKVALSSQRGVFLSLLTSVLLAQGKRYSALDVKDSKPACFLHGSCNCTQNLPLSLPKMKVYKERSLYHRRHEHRHYHRSREYGREPSECESAGVFRWLNPHEVVACLEKNPLLVIGDSRVGQVNNAVHYQMCSKKWLHR